MSIIYKGVRNGVFSKDKDGNISTERILVFLFNAGESSVKISQQTQIPVNGTAHPDDSTLLLSNVSISQKDGDEKKGTYEATLTYIRTNNNTITNNATVLPWKLKPYDIAMSPVEIGIAFQKSYKDGDSFGNPSQPVLNPAGDPYEDGQTRQNTILRFSYNLETFNSSWITHYVDTVNKSSTTVIDVSIDAMKGRLKNLTPSLQYQYDNKGNLQYTYWKIDVEIEISPVVWKREIMARGLYFLDGGKKYRIYTDNKGTYGKQEDIGEDGIPVDEPQRLTEAGALYGGTTGAFYQTFYDKFTANWSTLNLPKSAK